MSKFSVLKSNKADSLIKRENSFDKEVHVLASCGYNIITKMKLFIYIHLSCNDNLYNPRKHSDIYPLRNLQCKFHCFCRDYLSRVSTCD